MRRGEECPSVRLQIGSYFILRVFNSELKSSTIDDLTFWEQNELRGWGELKHFIPEVEILIVSLKNIKRHHLSRKHELVIKSRILDFQIIIAEVLPFV